MKLGSCLPGAWLRQWCGQRSLGPRESTLNSENDEVRKIVISVLFRHDSEATKHRKVVTKVFLPLSPSVRLHQKIPQLGSLIFPPLENGITWYHVVQVLILAHVIG